jgi:hypothetical protein
VVAPLRRSIAAWETRSMNAKWMWTIAGGGIVVFFVAFAIGQWSRTW